MDLDEIVKFHREFALSHGWKWEVNDEKELLERIKYIAIAITGEAGEFSNIVKKSLREKFPDGQLPDAEKMEKLKQEVVDIFIYVILASLALKMDLQKEHDKKVEELRERFKRFEKK
jgi:NTP pyrophosphatase (non-canonical NTP hydrolase)